jgi:hypothetical protein
LYARRYDRAEQELLKALELDPNFFAALVDLSETYNAMGRSKRFGGWNAPTKRRITNFPG